MHSDARPRGPEQDNRRQSRRFARQCACQSSLESVWRSGCDGVLDHGAGGAELEHRAGL